MKRYLVSHLPMALGYGVAVFLVNAGWSNWWNWLGWITGVLVGVLILFADRIVYTYSYPGAQISQQFSFYWKAKKYGEAINLLDARRLEQERLAFRSALFMVVWVPLAIFTLTSTSALFGKGVVMGLMFHILSDAWRLQKMEPRRVHIRLFWMIKRQVSDEERLVFMYVITAIFGLMSFLGRMMFHLYGLIVGVAIVVGWGVAERIDVRIGRIAPGVIVGGLVGGRLWHVIEMWSYYSQNLSQIGAVWQGGMSIWGGIVAGGAIVWGYDRRLLGAVATAMPLAQAIGRIANGVNGEFTNLVLGIQWWGMEAILDLGLFGLLWIIPKKYRVLGYLLGYGLIRLVLQPYRSVE